MAEEEPERESPEEVREVEKKSEELVLSTLSVDDMREEQRIELAKHLLISSKVDKALEFLHEVNPVENIMKPLSEAEVEVRDIEDQMQQRIQDWLGMWDKTISESEDLPVDLVGRATELAKSSRSSRRE